jgi:hypothetical protein
MLYLLIVNSEEDPPEPPLFEGPINYTFSSLSSALRFPRKKIPQRIMKEFEMIPIIDKKTKAVLIPDHIPYV